MLKKIFFLVLCSLISLSSCIGGKDYTTEQLYRVYGTKTDVKITYSVDKGTETIIVKELPWDGSSGIIIGDHGKTKEWFLSAESDSEGEMTVQIGDERVHGYDEDGKRIDSIQESLIFAKQSTTSRYVQIIYKP